MGLGRMEAGLEALGRPDHAAPTLHVAGTNGKGSTCAFAATCLQTAGHRVGLYTSPHLVSVNERIRINGENISDEALGQRMLEILERFPLALDPTSPTTFFEMGTLLALWHFSQEKVDVVVLETGLGGRLDATSAARTSVSAITSIDFDHMEYLGHTLPEIAGEKAAIFRPGVPAVSTVQRPEARAVIEAAAQRHGIPVWLEGRDFELSEQGRSADGLAQYRWSGPGPSLEGLTLGLRGDHQRHNAAVALAALERLGEVGLVVGPEHRRQGLLSTRWPGRLEEVGQSPAIVLDGAHNPSAIETLCAALDRHYPGRRIHLVFAVLADKDHRPMLQRLFPKCSTVHLAPLPTPRSLPPEKYVEDARSLCAAVQVHPSVSEALLVARRSSGASDVVVCTGSLFLVGEAKVALRALTG
jgi:dihydrofolate synthase / folylpolyglutamate synthase